jgi:iron complex outermembrane recepter protein
MSRSRDGYVDMLDYGVLHNDNVPSNMARGRGNPDYSTMGGESLVAGRAALRWEATDRLEINISGDYTRQNDEAVATVLIAAGNPVGPGVSAELFDPFSTNPSTSLSNTFTPIPWLVGTDGNAVTLDCRFVPAGPYSCDTGEPRSPGL